MAAEDVRRDGLLVCRAQWRSRVRSRRQGSLFSNRSAANNPAVAPTDNPDPLQFNLPCFIPAANASASAIGLLALPVHELRDLI